MTILQHIAYDKQNLIDIICTSRTKLEIFKRLDCCRNSFNTRKLNDFIKDNNLSLLNREINNDNKTKCRFCGNEYKITGISYHEKYCKCNPNKEVCVGNRGNTKGHPAWNLGKTKETDERIKRYGETFTKRVKSGEIVPTWKDKKLPEDMRNKISKTITKYFDEHGNPGWKGRPYGYMSYPEQYFSEVFINNDIPLKFHLPVGRYELDFYNEDLMKYIEIDGEQHYRTQERIDADKRRDQYLLEHGWVGKRINWAKFKRMSREEKDNIVKEIKDFIS